MLNGLVELPIWGYVLVTLAMTHITIVSVTVYLHRHQAHRALELHPWLAHCLRFWLWLTTGMRTAEWVAVHRKHHACVETADDPHSPVQAGISKVLWDGVSLYQRSAHDPDTVAKYGHGTPDDWLERNLYSPHSYVGIAMMFLIDIVLFGPLGITIWAVQMAWIPFFAAGVINGIGHWWGYRNFETADASTNIVPWGILIGGEELHNNHHAYASSARFSNKWWEFDLGWFYIQLMVWLGLARVKKVAPKLHFVLDKAKVDLDTVSAVISNRFQVMAHYGSSVLARVYREELGKANERQRGLLRRARFLLTREESQLSRDAQAQLRTLLEHSQSLKVTYQFKRRLQALWEERTASSERLLQGLQQWCREAEDSGIRALQEFARGMPSYVPAASAI